MSEKETVDFRKSEAELMSVIDTLQQTDAWNPERYTPSSFSRGDGTKHGGHVQVD